MDIKIAFSIREVSKSKSDSVFFPTTLRYKNGNGVWDSIPVEIRARGNFRRAKCGFPPLRLKIKKKDAKGTVFEGNKSLKLVLPCQSSGDYNKLIQKEYVCYQLYQAVSQHTFNTRMLNITLTNQTGKSSKEFALLGFFIEDDDLVADRFGGKITETKMHPLQLQDTTALRHDFFQHLIANTDWSSVASHNVKILVANKTNIPLAYDFDMSGLVDAPYAGVNESLDIKSVRQRLYRGFCRAEPMVEFTRQYYLSKEAAIFETLNQHTSYFEEKEFARTRKYIEEYFEILKSDKLFKVNIIGACRTK